MAGEDVAGRTLEERAVASLPEDALWCGLPALFYRNDLAQVLVVPERGGKIASLRDSRGREWLEQPAGPLRELGERESFVDGDMCGWDECAPTIVACDVDGVALPDHGELWSRPWSLGGDGWLVTEGGQWGYQFGRRVSVEGPEVRLDYRLVPGVAPFPFLWVPHPQFVVDQASRVVLPESVRAVTDVLAGPYPGPLVPAKDVGRVSSVAPGQCQKFYVAPDERINEVALLHGDGSRLTLTWTDEVPYLGVWTDRGAYARNEVVALEPSTGFYDNCSSARRLGRILTAEPGTEVRWSLSLRFSQDPQGQV